MRGLKFHVDLIVSSENFGFSGGNNLGIHRALRNGSEYILLLNNDTVIDPEAITELIVVAQKDKRIGLVSPKIFYEHSPSQIWSSGGKFGWLSGSAHLDENKFDRSVKQLPKIVHWGSGAALLIRSDVIRDIGMMDYEYFLYFEDVDLALRARAAGYLVAFAPKAYVYHKVSKSVRRVGVGYIARYHFRNALLLVRKNAPWYIRALMIPWSIMIIGREALKFLLFKDLRDQSGPAISGIFDYWKGKVGKLPVKHSS